MVLDVVVAVVKLVTVAVVDVVKLVTVAVVDVVKLVTVAVVVVVVVGVEVVKEENTTCMFIAQAPPQT